MRRRPGRHELCLYWLLLGRVLDAAPAVVRSSRFEKRAHTEARVGPLERPFPLRIAVSPTSRFAPSLEEVPASSSGPEPVLEALLLHWSLQQRAGRPVCQLPAADFCVQLIA
ncbi:hypothetical protein J6590_013936 [Homalodisca vitripennis]|nr:hypothetical protein J6590_013936 [Homalodisca vitripennis]